MILNFFRSDGMSCGENLTLGPVLLDGDYHIISNRNMSIDSVSNNDILSYLSQMDQESYVYFLILFIVFISFVTIMQVFVHNFVAELESKMDNAVLDSGTDEITVRTVTHRLLINIWNFYDLCLSQEGYYVNTTTIGLAWFLVLCFFIYYTFLLVLLNFMTTEQLSVIDRPKIDTVDDLMEMMGPGKYRPSVLKGFEIDEIMEASDKSSNLGRIWQHMKDDLKNSLIDVAMNDRASLGLMPFDSVPRWQIWNKL